MATLTLSGISKRQETVNRFVDAARAYSKRLSAEANGCIYPTPNPIHFEVSKDPWCMVSAKFIRREVRWTETFIEPLLSLQSSRINHMRQRLDETTKRDVYAYLATTAAAYFANVMAEEARRAVEKSLLATPEEVLCTAMAKHARLESPHQTNEDKELLALMYYVNACKPEKLLEFLREPGLSSLGSRMLGLLNYGHWHLDDEEPEWNDTDLCQQEMIQRNQFYHKVYEGESQIPRIKAPYNKLEDSDYIKIFEAYKEAMKPRMLQQISV